jgi:hypothetical protein
MLAAQRSLEVTQCGQVLIFEANFGFKKMYDGWTWLVDMVGYNVTFYELRL